MPRERKAKKPVDEDNPERLPSAPNNSLFGKASFAPSSAAAASSEAPAENSGSGAKSKAAKRPRAPVAKEDPAVAKLREAKRRKKAEGGDAAQSAPTKTFMPGEQKAARPHAEAVEKSNRLWERLRSEKTAADERTKLVDEVLALFKGAVVTVLQKHDAARVLQSCFKQGTAEQRGALLSEIAAGIKEVARSHYGHFLLISILRHGTTEQKQRIVAELTPHAAELMVHAEGSTVLQQLYTDVANHEQKNEMFRALWSKEVALMGSGESSFTSLAELFAADPLCKGRVLRRLEILLSKATSKGLAVTALVQRGAAELLEHGDATQRAELVNSLREQAVHIMHTRDGARIACGCLRHGDAKDRKALLKGLKGYVARAALDQHGALVLCVALEAVDDTVLLSKAVLSELTSDLLTLALHPQGSLPLLQLLSPRAPRYFTPVQLAIMGDQQSAASKKDPALRRRELLPSLLPGLLSLCASHPATLAASAHGSSLAYEALRVAAGGDDAIPADGNTSVAAAAAFAAIAKAATDSVAPPPNADEGRPTALVVHHYGGRLLKRLVQAHAEFASALLPQLGGRLQQWALDGAGWVVLALLESPATADRVRAELEGAKRALAKSDGAGCAALSKALPDAPAAASSGGERKKKARKKL